MKLNHFDMLIEKEKVYQIKINDLGIKSSNINNYTGFYWSMVNLMIKLHMQLNWHPETLSLAIGIMNLVLIKERGEKIYKSDKNERSILAFIYLFISAKFEGEDPNTIHLNTLLKTLNLYCLKKDIWLLEYNTLSKIDYRLMSIVTIHMFISYFIPNSYKDEGVKGKLFKELLCIFCDFSFFFTDYGDTFKLSDIALSCVSLSCKIVRIEMNVKEREKIKEEKYIKLEKWLWYFLLKHVKGYMIPNKNSFFDSIQLKYQNLLYNLSLSLYPRKKYRKNKVNLIENVITPEFVRTTKWENQN